MVEKLGNLLNLDSHQRPSWVAFYPINVGEGGFYAEAGKFLTERPSVLKTPGLWSLSQVVRP